MKNVALNGADFLGGLPTDGKILDVGTPVKYEFEQKVNKSNVT